MDLSSQLRILEEENRRLRDENTSTTNFLSLMVHQLRTPLSATKWIFKMMMDGDLGTVSDEQRAIIKRGFESNEQMIHMLADISNAHHTGEWKLHFTPAPMDMTELLSNEITSFSSEAKMKQISLSFLHEPSLPPVIADREKLRSVVQNLLENAIKYNRIGGTVTVRAEVFKTSLVVSVSDTGMGIPLNEQPQIFKKCYRASNAKAREPGTGLGLFVGKEIIEGNKGMLWFESTENVGSTFFFSLPIAR